MNDIPQAVRPMSVKPDHRDQRIEDLEDDCHRLHAEKMTFFDALLGIATMDVLTRRGEQPPHELMRDIACKALKLPGHDETLGMTKRWLGYEDADGDP